MQHSLRQMCVRAAEWCALLTPWCLFCGLWFSGSCSRFNAQAPTRSLSSCCCSSTARLLAAAATQARASDVEFFVLIFGSALADFFTRHLTCRHIRAAGYDVVFVAGQSNAVGNSLTSDTADAVNDAVPPSLPVLYAQFGIDGRISGSGWDGSAGAALTTPQSGPPSA